MSTQEHINHFQKHLGPVLGAGEAASVTRLVMEDLFAYRKGGNVRELTEEETARAYEALARLLAGEPVQYVTGIADFYGLQLRVSPAVLIPRPETEELVEWILEDYPAGSFLRVADLGTGSGCIPLALKAKRPEWACSGWDVSKEALRIADWNSDRLALLVDFAAFDLLAHGAVLEQTYYDVLVSNPPYIPPSEQAVMGASTVGFEPALALYAPEEDPLLFYRRISRVGQSALIAGGRLYLEVNEFNSEQVVSLLERDGYVDVSRKRDLQGKWRMVRATRPAPTPAP